MSSYSQPAEKSICPPCGSRDTYTQAKGPHVGLYCEACRTWLKWIPHQPIGVMPFGKHKGSAIAELPDGYLNWALENLNLKKSLYAVLAAEFERREQARVLL